LPVADQEGLEAERRSPAFGGLRERKLGADAQAINMRLNFFSMSLNPNVTVPPGAPDFAAAELISYDTGKHGGSRRT
jgi:hypothetical protein